MKLIYTVVIMLIVIFVITFSLENTVPIPIKYYGIIDITAKSYLVIFVSFFAGIVIAGFLDVVERFRLARTVKRLNKKIKEMERKYDKGENLPMTTDTEP